MNDLLGWFYFQSENRFLSFFFLLKETQNIFWFTLFLSQDYKINVKFSNNLSKFNNDHFNITPLNLLF